MAVLSPKELLDWLGRNHFLAPEQSAELSRGVSAFPDSHTLAKELIRRNWLSPYQVNQILQGNHETLVLGNYRLRERLGEGAMGQVFKAWNVRTHRIVAIKTIRKDLVNSTKALERFRREVETASQLEHANIAHVIDAEDVEGRLFLAMDFVEGFNLSQRVKLGGALPIGEAVEYARQTALGLQHAYERGIVHRDIKPANLMVAPAKPGSDAGGTVKILDFGLARFESEGDNSTRLTQVGNLLGTIDYVAPEQAQNAKEADIRADIYSLGCTLFYLLCARPPFLGNDVVEKLGPRIVGEPPSVRAVRSEVPTGLDAVILKLMARRPEDRYQTPIEAAKALEPYAVAAAPVALATPISAAPASNAALATMIAPPRVVTAQPVRNGGAAAKPDSAGVSSSPPPGPQPNETPTRRIPKKWLIAGVAGAGLASSICLVACLLFYFWPKPPAPPAGEIRFTELKYSMADKIAKQGQRHMVIVKVQRINFSGPVSVAFKNLPDGVVGNPLTIDANSNKGELWFTVRYDLEPLQTQVIVRAEHKSSGAVTEQRMPFTVGEHPDQKWKNK